MNTMQKALIPVFGGAGVLHFVKPEPFDGIVPEQLPGSARTYTYVSGVAELATAALLANTKTRASGGAVAAALLLAVWPANFNMAWQWRNKPWYLQAGAIARLPMQIPMIRAGWDLYKQGAK